MYISTILKEMGIPHTRQNEQNVSSLGLVEYNDGNDVCTFIENEKYIEKISNNIRMVFAKKDLLDVLNQKDGRFGVCIVEDPRLTYFRLHNYLSKDALYNRPCFPTQIGANCKISNHAVIADRNVVIGNNVTIEEFVVIRENTVIGDNSVIRAGCKIAGEGFEFKNTSEEVFHVNHIGGVIIGNSVEIQYNTCIDRAIYPWDNTLIGDYVKIDNLVHIGHAVKVDARTMIVANSGIGGRVSIGKDAWIGFGATIRNGLQIGDKARTNMGSVVTQNVGAKEAVTGNFAIPHEEFIVKLKK